MTNQDLVNHREYVEELISRYSQYIDEYKFDEFKHMIYNPYLKRDGDDEVWLRKIYNSLASDIKLESWETPGQLAARYLTQTICKLEDISDLINDTLKHNSGGNSPFDLFTFYFKDKLVINSDEIPAWYFKGTKFQGGRGSSVHVEAMKIHKEAFKNVYMAGGSLYIEEGCEEIDKSALEGSFINSIYLPRSLKRLGIQSFNSSVVMSNIHYNGTSLEYIELLKNSGWKKIPKIHQPVICTDKVIKGGLDVTTL